MDRKAQRNPNVSLPAEEIEEHHYVNEAAGVEENVRSALGLKFPSFSQFSPLLAAYWLILLVVIPLHIHFHIKVEFELKLLKANRAALMAKNQNLTTELEQEKNQIETMTKTWNEQNISRAQWSIDEYCRIENNKRTCFSCQKGCLQSQSSCYSINDAEPPRQKTWEEARENCRGKSSDLTVVGNEAEKMFVKDNSWVNDRIKGYWIGLRVEEGRWKWIDGSDLTNQAWIQQHSATDGQCVTSLQDQEWRSVRCNERNAWICEKKALSV
ncbi:hypothetical protein XENORESO_020171 [Xenotaenia resolanae]|uniref:C-type lectin domain-containing protein n=1 Tax=Xenotaenia resolanae TaxID=208358 RepID=A0ABV0WZV9_9TELE